MKVKLGEVMISAQDLQKRVKELANQIMQDYAGQEILMIGVLKGAVIFLVDLAKQLDLVVEMDFMAVSSYGASTESSGIVRIIKDLDDSVEGKNVLIVEDIVDTGLTLKYIVENIAARNPANIRVCTLFNKQKQRKADVKIDYVGFEIPDSFIVGYGLDYDQAYRNLPNIHLLIT
ncbi:MAG: hypoxanthine phosphoribosyltransferase [Dehalococcoidia bacterium]|nr:hypoxanthine phosphoribosyltransferase [Dehalococcoidia bacterium]